MTLCPVLHIVPSTYVQKNGVKVYFNVHTSSHCVYDGVFLLQCNKYRIMHEILTIDTTTWNLSLKASSVTSFFECTYQRLFGLTIRYVLFYKNKRVSWSSLKDFVIKIQISTFPYWKVFKSHASNNRCSRYILFLRVTPVMCVDWLWLIVYN